MNKTCSIMCVTYNRVHLTKKTFDSLFKSIHTPFRLIIVDNNSTDNTEDFLFELKETLKNNPLCKSYDAHFNVENYGIGGGRNQCLKIANKYNDKYLSTIDNDVDFSNNNNWLEDCIDFIDTNPKFSIGINLEEVNYPIKEFNNKKIAFKDRGNLGTACTVFSRKMHEDIGFFLKFGKYGLEDSNFFLRSRVAGYQMGYLPTPGIHLGKGNEDVGEYREFKTNEQKKHMQDFIKECNLYSTRKKSIKLPYSCPDEKEPKKTICEIY